MPLLLRASARLGPIPTIAATGVLSPICLKELAIELPSPTAHIQSEICGESKILNPLSRG
jgi:hypothetical protein